MNQEQACTFCTGKILTIVDTHEDGGVTYELYHCEACGCECWSPMKNPGATWYERDERYANRNIDPILQPNQKHKDTVAFFGKKTGRVLDVGCGVGNFLALAKKQGWECWGIDFDKDSIVTAQNTFGLKNMEVSDLTTFIKNHPNERFDLVTFFDVFEHIDNHIEFIAQVKSILNPGGHIALSVPYRNCWRWLIPNDLPPRHLTRWNDTVLGAVLEKNGFRVAKVWKLGASWDFLVMKFRWKYGRFVRFGLVKDAKLRAFAEAQKNKEDVAVRRNYSASIKLLHFLAKAKDRLLFGVPATLLWLALYPTDKKHTDFYLVAELNHD